MVMNKQMKNVLIVSGHTDLANSSVANKAILEELQKILPGAEYDFLDELYPDYKIDIKKEQEKLVKADIIVLQFPVFWYQCPSLMRKWFEDVWEYEFSYGPTGNALAGKKLLCSLTTGSPADAYQAGGLQSHTIDEYIVGLRQLAYFCNMEWAGYLHMDAVPYATRVDEKAKAEVIKRSVKHAQNLVEKISVII